MVDFAKYTGAAGQQARIELQEKFERERKEYKVKIDKLMELFDEGCLPDTEFVNSFMPRVASKFNADIFPLSDKEKAVIDKMFEEN